jgi:hypothetical protein
MLNSVYPGRDCLKWLEGPGKRLNLPSFLFWRLVMKRQSVSLTHVGLVLASSGVLFLLGCVSLDKPENVKICSSSAEGCLDSPMPKFLDASVGGDVKASPDTVRSDTPRAQDTPWDGTPDTLSAPEAASDHLAASDTSDDLIATADLLLTPDLPVIPDLPGLNDLPPVADLALPLDVSAPDLTVPNPADVGGDLVTDFPVDPLSDVGLDLGQLDTETGNCITQIIGSGYRAGSAPACAACNDGNGNSLAGKCTAMLDCLAPPRTSADSLYCLNRVSGSSRVSDCVTALTKVGCPSGF